MQLITQQRPFTLPVYRNGEWRDDFAVTGAVEPGYAVLFGVKSKSDFGLKLSATTGVSADLRLPVWYNVADFAAEIAMRVAAGTSVHLQFRTAISGASFDNTNRWYLDLNGSANTLTLTKVVANVSTAKGTVSGVTGSAFQRIGLRCVGPQIEVYLNGARVLNVSDVDNRANGRFRLVAVDGAAGVAVGEYQYLVVKPL